MITPAQAYQPGAPLKNTTAMLVAMKEKGTLQSYVAQHRNSPEYPMLLSLAATINQVSDATKAAQHQQPQQTVADQQLAALAPAPTPQPLPEHVGIGQLPAPNMETIHKASGGIIAFGEGGDVPRYADKGLVFDPETGSFVEDVQRRGPVDIMSERLKQSLYVPTSRGLMPRAQAEAQGLIGSAAPKTAKSVVPSVATMPSDTYSRPGMQNDPRLVGSSTFAEQTAPTLNAQKAAAAAVEEGAGKPPAGGGASASTGIDALMESAKKYFPKGEEAPSDRTGFLKEREEVRKPIYEKMDKMIEDEKGKLKGDREQAFFMSMIEGGLAAAGGSSQYGLQNLAQGFSKGAASFGEALKDIRKAARENSKMEVEAQRMRSADKIGDMDAFQRSEESYKQRQATRDAAMTSGVFALTGDKMRADATLGAARITAGAPGAQERLLATLGGGDVAKGLKLYQDAQTDKTGASYAKLYADYAANADKAGAEKMSPVEFAQNIQLFMGSLGGGGFQAKPGDTTVRKLPGTR